MCSKGRARNAAEDQFLQLILVGQPQLGDILSSSRMLQFSQPISYEFPLRVLSTIEVSHCIDCGLRAADAGASLFSREACDMITGASGGIPRFTSILGDTA